MYFIHVNLPKPYDVLFLSMSVTCSRFITHNVDGCMCANVYAKTEDEMLIAVILMIDRNWYAINVCLVKSWQ